MNEEVELKVCKGCDAPLPYKPKVKSFFKKMKIFVTIVYDMKRESE